MKLSDRLKTLPSRISELIEETNVPGVSLAVMHHDEVFETAAGYVNLAAKIETTTDAVFQIGSITKLFTTTLIQQLVDKGELDLDAPVRKYLPEFQLADQFAAETITVRHLLTHTSGMDGDYFEDTGKGDNCIERYILACRALPQLHPPGKNFSYCNAGFVVAGRIIEKLTGNPWPIALKSQIIHPLQLTPMGTEPEEAIFNRVAVGHMPHPDTGQQQMVPVWRLTTSNGPAGATPFGSARNLLSFAAMILNRGKDAEGGQFLSEPIIESIQTPQVEVPDSAFGFNGLQSWGIGWMIFDWEGKQLIGHDGRTTGQFSYLRVMPEEGIAVSLLANGGDAAVFSRAIFSEVFGALAGVRPPMPPCINTNLNLDLNKYCGTFQRLSARYDIELKDGKLVVTNTGQRAPFTMIPPQKITLEPVSSNLFLAFSKASQTPTSANFLKFDEAGRPGYIHISGRAAPRVS